MSFYSNNNGLGSQTATYDLPAIMRAVYMWVALGLLVAFGVAYAVGAPVAAQLSSGAVRNIRQLNSPLFNPAIVLGSMIAYIILALALQPVIMRARPAIGSLMYLVFTALFGFMMSTIFITYTVSQISTAFIATAATFGAMSIIGYTTKIDLSRMGSILMMALIGLIIATVVNIFLRSSGLMMLINYAGVLIFVGLTAYDTQWIKNTASQMAASGDPDMVQRMALIGAFHLFLDFVNLFLFILRILGGRGRR
jgi:uncharacterized protein